MKKIIITAVISMFALVGCSSEVGPVPVVTITEQAPPNMDDGATTQTQLYVDFVRDYGGLYASVANDKDLLTLGAVVCEGYQRGLSEQDIVSALSYALIENNMDNQDGAQFAAAIIVGSERYLCNISGGINASS